jgi:hypothetical protein
MKDVVLLVNHRFLKNIFIFHKKYQKAPEMGFLLVSIPEK